MPILINWSESLQTQLPNAQFKKNIKKTQPEYDK